MPLAPGQTLSTYEILGPLGAGGMGDVYRARDTRLDREVALKVLAPEAAAQPDHLNRFLREARVLASLDHPNVVAVHSVEVVDGLHFLTMGLVSGQSLATRIPEAGMAPDELLPLARSIAEGVSAVHAHGIVHRDLKPANIMITDEGHVKLVDFGLAKLEARAEGSMELTSMGAAVGTIPYMSPEQLRGAPVDARSDIFALGVVLYEMATGRRPFAGESGADVISSILNDDPRPLSGSCCELAPALRDVVARCLNKDPEERYASVGRLLQDLLAFEPEQHSPASITDEKRARPHLSLPTRPSLAVLPFANLSGDPGQDHLATGLWFDLNAELVKLAGLFLLNGTSTATFAGRSVDAREVGQQLGVRHVLEGTVRQAGNRIRITVQLVDTETGQPAWAEHYDREMDDLFAVQDEINAKIVEALDVQLLWGEGARTMRSKWKHPHARDLFYRAVPLSFTYQLADLEKARRLLDQVEREDPGVSQTYSHLGWTYYFEAASGLSADPARAIDQAQTFAAKAVEISDPSGMGHMLTATLHLIRGDHVRASEAGRVALEKRPGCPWAYAVLGNIYNYVGEPHHALQLAEQAIRLSPLVPHLFPAVMATSYYLVNLPEDAVAAARSAIELDADGLDAHVMLAAALVASGRAGKTPSVVADIRRIKPEFTLQDFAQRQPYRDLHDLEDLLADLRLAGL